MWTYQCQMGRVVDGDTIDLIVDVGFYTRRRIRVKLRGVDTNELHGVKKDTDEYEEAVEQAEFVRDWFGEGFAEYDDGDWPFVVETEAPTGKYGRWIGTIERKSDESVLNEDLVVEFPSVERDTT